MRANTGKIYDRLIRGTFISVDSTDADVRHLFSDIEENFDDYESYFKEIGLKLDYGDGYYYFSRSKEAKLSIEQKLLSFAQWVDILDFLKTYDIAFSTGYQFRATQILERVNLDIELREKARKLFRKQKTNQEVVEKLTESLTHMGYAEIVNEQDGTYKVTSAFRYVEDLVNLITIFNEEEPAETPDHETP